MNEFTIGFMKMIKNILFNDVRVLSVEKVCQRKVSVDFEISSLVNILKF